MKKESFQKKLAAYVTIASAYLAAHPVEANAQIMYTDVSPNLVIDNSYFNLDLNNDGVMDVQLQNSHYDNVVLASDCSPCSGTFHLMRKANLSLNDAQIMETVFYGYNPIEPLNAGDTIKAANIWGDGNAFSPGANLDNFYSEGYWTCVSSGNFTQVGYGVMSGGTEKFLGFKINTNGNNYYGWARIELQDNDNIILKDYAINSIPDSLIIAGDTGSLCNANNFSTIPNGLYLMCNGTSVDVNLNNAGNQNIQWLKRGNWLVGETDSTYTINQSGDYQVLLADSDCAVVLNAIQIQNVYFSVTPLCSKNETCWQSNGEIMVNVIGNSSGYSYLWSNGDTTQNIINLSAGVYQLTVTSSDCQIVHTIQTSIFNNTIDCVGINEVESPPFQFSVTDKKIFFQFPDNSFLNSQLEIINELGQQVRTVTVTTLTQAEDLSALPAGIYFYYIRSKQKSYSGKFIIE